MHQSHHVLHGLWHHVPPTFLSCFKTLVFQKTWFELQTMGILNHVSTFSCHQNSMYKPHAHTQPINCKFIPQKDTMIPSMARTRHYLNNQVFAISPPSTTIQAMLHYSGCKNSPIFSTKWYVIKFFLNIFCNTFYIFYNLVDIRSQYISWITSPIWPPFHHLHFRPSTECCPQQ